MVGLTQQPMSNETLAASLLYAALQPRLFQIFTQLPPLRRAMHPLTPTSRRGASDSSSKTPAHTTPAFIPPPLRDPTLLLIARWKGLFRDDHEVSNHVFKHEYVLAIRPSESITIGRRVRILAITPIAYRLPQSPNGQYDTYDPHLVGWVAEMWRVDDERGRARLVNVCCGNAITEVVLDFPCARKALAATGKAGERGETLRESSERGLEHLTSVRPMPVWRLCDAEACWTQRATGGRV